MNRTNICKNIVQSVKDYIKDQVKLEPHRVEKHFVRRRKLSLLQVFVCFFMEPWLRARSALKAGTKFFKETGFERISFYNDFL